jgi:hypothetical protein
MCRYLLAAVVIGVPWLTSPAFAEKAPLSEEGLQDEAQAVVVATIEKIRIRSEPATFERGFGNSDWGIYLTLNVESVEKGDVAGQTLEARCFRIRSRRSVQEYLTPSGHHPIPDVGTRVRAYLERQGDAWAVVLPNGIRADGRRPGERLADAKQVTALRSLAYTYVLPLEAWLLVLVIGIPLAACLGWLRKRKRRMHSSPVSGSTA